jgi:hypothetical protein
MKKRTKKLALARETITNLTKEQSSNVPGGDSWGGITQCYDGTCNASCGEPFDCKGV